MAKFTSHHHRSHQLCSIVLAIFVFCTIFSVSTTAKPKDIRMPVDLCAGTITSSCPATCFQTQPVCGADGVTYWCGCPEAACAGAEVAKLGFCEVGNGGSATFPGQALLLVHIVWLIVLGFSVLFGLF